MHKDSYENEFDFHVNDISFHMKEWVRRLAMRKGLKEIRKWTIKCQQSAREGGI